MKSIELKVQLASTEKYKKDEIYRTKVKASLISQYKNSEVRRQNVKKSVYAKLKRINEDQKKWTVVHENFQNAKHMYPDHVCSVCYKLLFRKQVLNCQPDTYNKKTT